MVLRVSGAIRLFPLLIEGLKVEEGDTLRICPLAQKIVKDFLLELVGRFRACGSVCCFVDTRPACLSNVHWLANADRCHVLSHGRILLFRISDSTLHCRLSHSVEWKRLLIRKHSPERGVVERIVEWIGVNGNEVDSAHELSELVSVVDRIAPTPRFIVV